MPPSGSAAPLLYVLGEAPGENEDVQGEQFVGDSGKRLRALLPPELLSQIRWNNVVRTRPPKNRTPLPQEVEHYRSALVADIEKTRPKAVLAVGALPLSWALPGAGTITLLRGRKFPIKVGRHICWCFPVHHPAWVLRVENRKEADIPGAEWRKVWESDVRAACAAVLGNLRTPPYLDNEDLAQGLVLATDWPADKISRWLERLHGRNCALDIETTCLRPYEKGARIVTIAVSDAQQAFAFPFSEEVAPAFLAWLKSPGKRIAFGGAFELEWFAVKFGAKLLREVPPFEDAQAQAYVLDERGTDDGSGRKRGGCHNLDFLCRLHFGLALKSKSDIDRKNIGRASLEPLLRYNALDAKFTYMLWAQQRLLVQEAGLEPIYKEHLRRIPTAVLAQTRGLLVDSDRVQQFKVELQDSASKVLAEISALPEVDAFRKRRGKYNPNSPIDVLAVLKDLGHADALKTSDSSWSTDDELLCKLDEPIAQLTLKLRKILKLSGTYVERMEAANPRSYVFPDGRIHPRFNTLRTVTGRFSSADPNAQNFPKRKHAEIRSQLVADRGCVLVALDYGQLEARVIASLSGQFEVAMTDIHMDWAERIASLHPPVFKKRGSNMKAFRSDIKNQLVFPLFYGTTAGHIGAMLELPRRISEKVYEEFWSAFPKVRKWQHGLLRSYQELGYVEGPTGRRRRAPMSNNEIINTPVQGSASDIVVDAMNRLSERAFTEDCPRLQPVLNIHDDLTLCVPKKHQDGYVDVLVSEALTTAYDWVRVPLQVEVSVGPNWHELKEIGKFNSDDPAAV